MINRERPRQHYDVVIIGAGPVGTGLAIDLAQRGHSVCLVEKYKTPQPIPKGQNLTQRSGEHLRRWGVSADIRKATLIPPSYGNQGITAYGSWLSEWHYDWFKRASVREYYFADNERLPQYETERVLRARTDALDNIDFFTGWSYHDCTEQNNSLRVTVKPVDSAVNHTIESLWLVGCDGARSPVRESNGIEQTIDSRNKRMALVTFRSAELNQLLSERYPGCTIFNAIHPDLDGYWQFLGRTDTDDAFFFHAPVADDATADSLDFSALIKRAAGIDMQAIPEYVGFWDLRFTQANNYRHGRVFVAGDAAHSHPPYGGYGVNVGFEDARNLAWKLDAALCGWSSDALLDSYSAERHPVFASTRDHFIAHMIDSDAAFTAQYSPVRDLQAFTAAWHDRAQGGQKEVSSYVPHYSGSPIVITESTAASGAVGEHSHKATAGYHLSPRVGELTNGGVSAGPEANSADSTTSADRLFDRLGPGFSLIVCDSTANAATASAATLATERLTLVSAFTVAAKKLRLPLNVITVNRQETINPPAPDYVLVRPDEYVAWAGNRCDAENILRIACARQ
jgi:2-polyprenyl-6-methoxyphenol hydroxylase-like FAD-dependent oxidoreductase